MENPTTIRIEKKTKEMLKEMKIVPREPFNDVLERIIGFVGDIERGAKNEEKT